jgi:tRNA (cytidine/uridine-2'-O-)-methyltransferase
MRLGLFQPDIPQNFGALIRIAACFETPLEVIEPCGFPMTDRRVRRAGLDYAPLASIRRHESWRAFLEGDSRTAGRLVLFSTSAATSLWNFRFEPNDLLLFGQESVGAPDYVHDEADARVVIPISSRTRSLNLAVSAGIAIAEARRQVSLAGKDPEESHLSS